VKILISINTFWNIYNFRVELINALQSKGHEVIALAPKDAYATKLEALGVKCVNINMNQQGINPFGDLKLIRDYYSIFKMIQPDLILSYTIKPNIYGNLAAKILAIPTINNISGLGTIFIKKTVISYIGRLLYKIGLTCSSHVFFQNNEDQQLFIKYKLIKPTKNSVIPGSGVDTTYFKSNRTTNLGNRFLFVGRLIRDKGVIEFLEAALKILQTYPDKQFLLIGELDCNNKTALNKSSLDYYLNQSSQIQYLGKTDDIKSLLSEVDVMVLPSYREGLSKSLTEAASMSLPIITTDVPGCREVVEHKFNGILCQVKSMSSLENAILEMILLSNETRHSMGLKGRLKIIDTFSNTIVIKTYLQQIKDIFTHQNLNHEN